MRPASEERRKSSRLAGKSPDAGSQPHSNTLGSPAFKLPGSNTPLRQRPPQSINSFGSPIDVRGDSSSTLTRKRGRARSLAFASPPQPSADVAQTILGDSPVHHVRIHGPLVTRCNAGVQGCVTFLAARISLQERVGITVWFRVPAYSMTSPTFEVLVASHMTVSCAPMPSTSRAPFCTARHVQHPIDSWSI